MTIQPQRKEKKLHRNNMNKVFIESSNKKLREKISEQYYKTEVSRAGV